MSELATVATVLEMMREFQAVFGPKSTEDALKLRANAYFDALRGIEADALKFATKRVMQEDQFFPKPHRLITLAQEWARRNRALSQPQFVDDFWCPNCQSRVMPEAIWGPMVGANGENMLTPDRSALLLCGVSRMRCQCSTPSPYVPEPDIEPARMLLSRITWSTGPQWPARRAAAIRRVRLYESTPLETVMPELVYEEAAP